MKLGDLSAIVLLALTACDPADDPESRHATWEDVQGIFDAHGCAMDTCHSAERAASDLVLEGPEARAQLFAQPCVNPSADLAGMKRVAPGDLDTSFLWTKVTLDSAGSQLGMPMPPIGEPLDPGELELLESWITQLAE